MNLQLLTAVAVLLLLAKLAVSLAQQLRSPLRTVPGPFIARLTSGWYAFKVWQGSFEEDNLKLHKRYGTIVRYAPDHYSISDPAAIKVIYGLGHSFAKSPWYSTWSSPGQWSIFGDQDVHRHAQNRRHYQAAYSMSQLVHYESFVDGCADLFVRRLSELSSADVSVDMRHWFQCYAFDVIGMVTYGKRLGFLDRGDDVGGVIDALDNHLSYATLVGIFPALHQYLFPIKNWWAGSKGAGRAYVISFTNERIREAQATPKANSAPEDTSASESFLSKFLAKHSAKPDDFTSFHVLSGCVSNMVAGSDTTAISLSAVLYYLLQNSASMRTLQDEIAGFTARGELSHRPTFKETQRMPYLQAVIKEALRLHPATGLPLERVVPDGGETISGRFFPGRSIVGINTWIAHRDQLIFGNDADAFLPERWLSDDTERVARMNHSYMPFGLGSRTCIGRHISMLEMSKLIPLLVRDFAFSLDGTLSGNHWHTHNAWFVKPIDFKVRVQVRAKSAESG